MVSESVEHWPVRAGCETSVIARGARGGAGRRRLVKRPPPRRVGVEGDACSTCSGRSMRPSAWRANRPASRSWTGSSVGHGQPPKPVAR